MQPLPAINRSFRAFTLIEVLTATAILSVLVIALGQMASLVTSSWTNAQGQSERRQTARAIADFIATDLAATLLPLEPASTTSFVLNPDLGGGGDINHPSAAFWLAPVATDQTFGDLAEVGYFVRWDDADPNHPRARLCRILINSGDPDYAADRDPLNWASVLDLDSLAPADKSNDYKGLFAEDVVGLWIRCLGLNPDGSRKELAGAGGAFDSSQYYETQDPVTDEARRLHLPVAVEVSLVTLDSRSAARIGPGHKAAITAMAKSSADAVDFVDQALKADSLRGISSGMRAFTTTAYLVNSK